MALHDRFFLHTATGHMCPVLITASHGGTSAHSRERLNTLLWLRVSTYCTQPPPNTESTDLYARLGVKSTARSDEIKQRFFELSKIHHPDAGGDAEKFRKIKESYDILSRADKRKLYDTGLISPDGKLSSITFLLKVLFSFAVLGGYLLSVAWASGMRVHDVAGLYMAFTILSSKIKMRGTRGLLIALVFCFITNTFWSKSVDARLVEDDFVQRSVDLIGPSGAKAKVTVMEGKKEIFSSEITLKGIRENIRVPLGLPNAAVRRDVRVQFRSQYYGMFRSRVGFVVEPINL
ncbi:chaperone DnaJ domain-containing protein [Perkinsela sp. CCAP 1560/4]|nr:chaperone DnaJ domain-containing protein [Perkinsela sp. CCAP 1560/4]|eukprot:KNH04939.1 chaperone DnaJ domain-containing protein [Perkinsela sp. CCAP 1560/4]